MRHVRAHIFSRIFMVSFMGILSGLLSVNANDDYKASDAVIYYSKNQSFDKFITWTNEKQRIVEEIFKLVVDKKDSLLDIGAGDGSITSLLAPKFDHITAVEPSLLLFETLKKRCASNKYSLINQPFELVTSEKKFDLILVSFALQYISNLSEEIVRMKDLLKDSGILLVIEPDQEHCELDIFHNKYGKEVLGTNFSGPVAHTIPFGDLLRKTFNVKEVHFIATLSIPSVDDAISIFDFIYDTEPSKMNNEAIAKIRTELYKEYGNKPLIFNNQEVIYICSK